MEWAESGKSARIKGKSGPNRGKCSRTDAKSSARAQSLAVAELAEVLTWRLRLTSALGPA